MNRYAISAIIGALITIIGFLIGFQLSPLLANILLFPIILGSKLLGTPFGEMNPLMLGLLFLLTILFWAFVSHLAMKRMPKNKKEKGNI